ncbi:MAG: PQQ-dependent sugar dehydrogenase [Fuerstiella sp.]|nr:PQQ-dependent sugar dehydrogenase [Fuerstiella sp.]
MRQFFAFRIPGMLSLSFVLFSPLISTELSASEAPEYGIQERETWTTSRITGSPLPPLPYVGEQVFTSLKFTNCLDITAAPGSDRLFIVEQSGKIFSFPNDPNVSEADLVIDFAKEIEGVQQTYALAFHPRFEDNRYCYVCYIKASSLEDGTHVARFRMTDTNPPTIDVNSETTILTWWSGGHNGCCLKFGHDGYLYISTGDGGAPNPPDPKKAGQDVSNLLSNILRLDVDHTEDGKNYRIPADNPFVDLPNVRGEIWAYGFRNPWRMSIDRKTGDLWVGDVGWELWESMNRVERGGNYGWAVKEGPASTNPEWQQGPTPIIPPTVAHPHSESSSITDGLTYYGSRLKELYGHHIYADYDTGKFWSLRYENGNVVEHGEIADTTHRVAGFGEDHDGEMYFLDHPAGTINRLIRNPRQDVSNKFPRKLSETGLFLSIDQLTPATGVIPYSINAEPWADFSVAERHVGVPGDLSIKPDGEKWIFPANSVLAKTLSLDMQQGDPATRRRIETQILHFDGTVWNPYTYQWNLEQTDATLVEASGTDLTLEIADSHAPNGIRKQTWRFSGRAECQRCHNSWSGPPLGFNTAQLNRHHDYGQTSASQLETYAHIQLIASPVTSEDGPQLTNPYDASASVEDRARAYLHTNCSHCHRMHAGGSVLSEMQYGLSLESTKMVNARPSQGTFGIHGARVITPGDPFRSVLFYRVAKLGSGRMPKIGSTEVDLDGVALIQDWLSQLPGDDEGTAKSPASLSVDSAMHLKRLQQAGSAAEQSASLTQLLSSTTGALMLLRSVDRGELSAAAVATTIQLAAHHHEPSVRDLFERFLSADDRVKRLGNVVKPEQIQSLTGDPNRGRQLFMEADSVSCRNCHRIQQQGREVGPELTAIGKKLNAEKLLESILDPSKEIDQKYITYLAETKDGLVITGLLISKDENEVVLKDATNKLKRIPATNIEELLPQAKSMMPDLLFRDMTAQQVADLVAYLGTLR